MSVTYLRRPVTNGFIDRDCYNPPVSERCSSLTVAREMRGRWEVDSKSHGKYTHTAILVQVSGGKEEVVELYPLPLGSGEPITEEKYNQHEIGVAKTLEAERAKS